MTPQAHTSVAGHHLPRHASGARYHGVPSTLGAVSGRDAGVKKAARPKSMAFSGAAASVESSRKFSGLTSRWMMLRAWHCATVCSTLRRTLATVRSL